MPEGDTVWRTASRLDEAMRGAQLIRAELRWGELIDAQLRGAITVEVRSRGKHILHRLSTGLTIHSHLRMEGQWRVEQSATLTSAATANHQLRALLVTQQWAALGLRLGMLDLIPTDREGDLVGHLGPDVLGADWDGAEAAARIRASDASIGQALLDQRNLAGVGTMYAAEALFVQRLHPWSPVAALSDAEVSAIVGRVHRMLHRGRSTAIQSTTGDSRPGERTFVHARSGRPCRRCGGDVRVAMIGNPPQDRTMFYCPACQGGLGPTDDGRPQRPLGSGAPRRAGYRRASGR
ncbi:MAG: DNA-formamidopyrimidine glycosylase family protein [Dermatophilaceae bacterium]